MNKEVFITKLFTNSLKFTIEDEPIMMKLEMDDDKWVDAVLRMCEVFAKKAEEHQIFDADPRLIEMILNSMSFGIKQDSMKFTSFGSDGVLAEAIIKFCKYAFRKLEKKGLLNKETKLLKV